MEEMGHQASIRYRTIAMVSFQDSGGKIKLSQQVYQYSHPGF